MLVLPRSVLILGVLFASRTQRFIPFKGSLYRSVDWLLDWSLATPTVFPLAPFSESYKGALLVASLPFVLHQWNLPAILGVPPSLIGRTTLEPAPIFRASAGSGIRRYDGPLVRICCVTALSLKLWAFLEPV